MRKWRENFLILSLYPPSLSISYIKICHILSQNVKYGIFVANVTKTEHTRYEEIILGRILCEEAPQVVTAWSPVVRTVKGVSSPLPHQAGIEILDFHARVWKSDQGGRISMQEMHGNQTKCMEFQPLKENSNFGTSIFCPGINFSCSKGLWI